MTAISTATHVRKNEGTPLWVMGSLFEVKASGAETGGALTVVEMTFAPGQVWVVLTTRNWAEAGL